VIARTPFVSTLYPPVSFLFTSLVVIRCVRVDVVLLLHHLAPHPFEPPFPIDPRSPALVLMMASSIRCGLHVAGCLSFGFFSIRYGRVQTYFVLYCKPFTEQR
jgi:hypothetical protein